MCNFSDRDEPVELELGFAQLPVERNAKRMRSNFAVQAGDKMPQVARFQTNPQYDRFDLTRSLYITAVFGSGKLHIACKSYFYIFFCAYRSAEKALHTNKTTSYTGSHPQQKAVFAPLKGSWMSTATRSPKSDTKLVDIRSADGKG